MRNLTIKRTKSFVGSLAKMKVYIEDLENGETQIGGLPCRKLGDLKNGEEKTFPIGDNAAKVFVIVDSMSRNLNNEYYPVPAGQEDIYLTGKNTYNPGAGNPFRFDGITDENILANRKKSNKKGTLLIIAAVIVGLLIGFFTTILPTMRHNASDKKFSALGMQITLTEDFKEVDRDSSSVTYESKQAVVLAIKDRFSVYEGLEDLTLEEYIEIVIENGEEHPDLKMVNKDGIPGFRYTYTDPEEGETFCYFVKVYKSDDAFWLIHFITTEEFADQTESRFDKWAKSITFN